MTDANKDSSGVLTDEVIADLCARLTAARRNWLAVQLSQAELAALLDERVALREQLRRSATVCPKDGCMLWKGHKIPHMTSGEIESMRAEVLDRREIMRTLRCDITLAEAKALEATKGATLQILKERGL